MAKKSKYAHLSREQIEARLEKLEKEGYGLKWEDKPEDVADLCDTQLPVLKEDKTKEIVSDTNLPTNYIIEGDNYHSLFTLNFTHKKKIDVIYIDPPYNTGKKNEWKYNDHWVDENDTYRHSKWLSFMNKRLRLAKQLLNEEGVIFCSIGQEELANLTMLFNKIFNENNQLGIITRVSKTAGDKGNYFAPTTDYILAYAKNKLKVDGFTDVVNEKLYKKIELDGERKGDKYRDDVAFYQSSLDTRPNQRYFIKCPDGSLVIPPGISMPKIKLDGEKAEPVNGDGVWRWANDTYFDESKKSFLIYKKSKQSPLLDEKGNQAKWNIYTKSYLKDRQEKGTKPRNLFTEFINRKGADLLKKLDLKFEYSKPIELVQYLISIINKKEDITVLDFFAGSGTTGHSILELNSRLKLNMKFILCTNNENNICTEITYPRIERIVNGYNNIGPYKANVKYFTQTFVNQVTSDKDKRELVNRSTELLCMAENTFNVISKRNTKNDFAIFGNTAKITAIIYDESQVDDCVNKLNQLNNGLPAIIYVFSYDHTYYTEDFINLKIKFTVKPIPEAILNVYRKIAKLRKK